jgi:hypothetical protein
MPEAETTSLRAKSLSTQLVVCIEWWYQRLPHVELILTPAKQTESKPEEKFVLR